MKDTPDIDRAVQSAAGSFVEVIFSEPPWHGREHEAVSLFALGFLQRECRPDSVLADSTQITVGGCVPGVPELNPKGRVNKDLVIWARPRMTCWDGNWEVSNVPMAVLEWKVFRASTRLPRTSPYDIHWLEWFSRGRNGFVGYAVSLDLAARGARLIAARVYNGSTDYAWLKL